MWVLFAILAPALYAVANILDNFLSNKKFKDLIALVFYSERLSAITTPEEAKAFAEEILMANLKPAEVDQEIGGEEEIIGDEPIKKTWGGKGRRTKGMMVSPWYDIVGNENESKVISLYAKGLTTRDIAAYMKTYHGMEITQPGVSTITDKVYPLVKEWQARPLSSYYPVVYLDGLHFKVREAGKIVSKTAYIALGINQYGLKEVLGIWISEGEGAKFWMGVLSEIKNRGVEDIFIVCVDGLKGFPDAIKTIFPQADVQVCVTHQVRHTIKFIPHKDREQFCDDLKTIYCAPSEEAGREALSHVMKKWPKYAAYLKSWETRWADLSTFFYYPEQVRRVVYTTNAIENLNRQFRQVTKTTVVFPHDDSLMKLLWLAQADIAQRWILSVRNWGEMVAQLSILFPDRMQF
jgi:putative transposase